MYQVNISTKENDTDDKAYIGMTSLNWKFRYYNHLQSNKKSNIKKSNCHILVFLVSERTRTNTYYKLENN